jgi:hypothetical protein
MNTATFAADQRRYFRALSTNAVPLGGPTFAE